jgi:hypothetical protein
METQQQVTNREAEVLLLLLLIHRLLTQHVISTCHICSIADVGLRRFENSEPQLLT